MEDIIKNPFPGLRAFEEEEEHLFFGRDNAVVELMSRLRTSRFLAVIGTSGSGKSSLIKAGLLPSLYRGFMSQAGSNWRVALFRPGDDPIGNLAEVLTGGGVLYETADDDDRGADRNVIWGKFIETTLRRSNRGLIEVVKQARLPQHENLLVVVDQFEELFRFSKLERSSQDEKRDSTAFVNLLLETAAQVELPVYILLTMRSDFLGDCTEFRGLPEAINNGQYLIPRMTRDEKRAAITGPVAVGGASITPTLQSRLLNDVGESPDQLPILQHAMMRTWAHWAAHHENDEPLDLRHYEAIGTMKRALSKHAEEAYAELKTGKEQTICEKMFKLLTDRGETGRGVRRPARVREICRVTNASEKEAIKVINVFRRPGRTFLMPPYEKKLDKDSVIDISHESLMRIWTRLMEWVEEEEQSAELYLRLAAAGALHEKGEVGFWRDPELMYALKWREANEPNAVWANRYDPSFDRAAAFLEASKKQQELETAEKERQQKAKLRNTRIFAAILFIGFIFVTYSALITLDSSIDAEMAKIIAETEKKKADKEKEKAQRLRKVAEKANRDLEEKTEESLKLQNEKNEATERALKEKLEKIEAEKNQLKRTIQKLIADMNKDEARFGQYVAKAKELAVHSIAEAKDRELKMLLALTAYDLNNKAYDDLKNDTQTKFNEFKDLKTRNNLDNVPVAKELAERYKTLQKKAKIRRRPAEIFEAVRQAYIAKEDMGDIIYTGAESWALAAAAHNNIVFNNREGELLLASFQTRPNDLKLPVINSKETTRLANNTMSQVSSLTVTEDRLFCGTLEGNLVYWEKNGWKKRELPGNHNAKILSMAFSKNRNCLLYSVKNTIYINNLRDMAKAFITLEENNFIRALTVIEDPGYKHPILIVGDAKGNIFQSSLLKEKKEKKPLNTDFEPDGFGFHTIAYNPSGKLLALANSRGEIFVFSGIDGKNLTAHKKVRYDKIDRGHRGIVRALAFSPGGRYLASGGLDGTIMLWDLEGKKADEIRRQAPVLIITGKRRQKILSIVFDPKDEYMIFSDEQNLRICPTNPQTFYEKLCQRKKRTFRKDEWRSYIGESIKQEDVIICPAKKGKGK